jgi:transmembrane sensor
VVLPDASEVTLHANSSVKLLRTWFGFQDREVWLEGEAFFNVQHTANHQRFVVHAGDRAQVEVLGTEFNVYHRERGTRVVLNSGSVKLSLQPGQQPDSPETTLVMEPGELVAVDPQSPGRFNKKVVDPALFSAWTTNNLQFRKTPLAEVARVLEEVYGLEVKFEDTDLAQLPFTGSSPIDQPKLLIMALSKSFNLRFSQQENVLLIQAE